LTTVTLLKTIHVERHNTPKAFDIQTLTKSTQDIYDLVPQAAQTLSQLKDDRLKQALAYDNVDKKYADLGPLAHATFLKGFKVRLIKAGIDTAQRACTAQLGELARFDSDEDVVQYLDIMKHLGITRSYVDIQLDAHNNFITPSRNIVRYLKPAEMSLKSIFEPLNIMPLVANIGTVDAPIPNEQLESICIMTQQNTTDQIAKPTASALKGLINLLLQQLPTFQQAKTQFDKVIQGIPAFLPAALRSPLGTVAPVIFSTVAPSLLNLIKRVSLPANLQVLNQVDVNDIRKVTRILPSLTQVLNSISKPRANLGIRDKTSFVPKMREGNVIRGFTTTAGKAPLLIYALMSHLIEGHKLIKDTYYVQQEGTADAYTTDVHPHLKGCTSGSTTMTCADVISVKRNYQCGIGVSTGKLKTIDSCEYVEIKTVSARQVHGCAQPKSTMIHTPANIRAVATCAGGTIVDIHLHMGTTFMPFWCTLKDTQGRALVTVDSPVGGADTRSIIFWAEIPWKNILTNAVQTTKNENQIVPRSSITETLTPHVFNPSKIKSTFTNFANHEQTNLPTMNTVDITQTALIAVVLVCFVILTIVLPCCYCRHKRRVKLTASTSVESIPMMESPIYNPYGKQLDRMSRPFPRIITYPGSAISTGYVPEMRRMPNSMTIPWNGGPSYRN
jgi:hypothetical protein